MKDCTGELGRQFYNCVPQDLYWEILFWPERKLLELLIGALDFMELKGAKKGAEDLIHKIEISQKVIFKL